jgi:6-phosphogluconolactonase
MLGLMDAGTETVYLGTTPGGHSGARGIYAASLDTSDGSLAAPAVLAAEVEAAGFLAWHPRLPVLYSLNGSSIASFRETGPGTLSPLNTSPSTTGKGTHLDISPDGKALVSVHYGAGTIAVFPLEEDGRIGAVSQVIELEAFSTANPERQGKPHPHSANFSPCGRYILVPDLGADTTYIYACDPEAATLEEHGKADSAPGAGPRHMKFSPDGRFAYVLNELDLTVDVFSWNADEGAMETAGTFPTLSPEQKAAAPANTASEIRFHPNGRFVYTANRGHNSITVFSVEPSTGQLALVEVVEAHVNWPRNFNLDPSGKWLLCAGQWSSDVKVFSIDTTTGSLLHLPEANLKVPGPICVEFGR